MYIGPQVDTPPAHRAKMDDNRHFASKGHSARPKCMQRDPDALSIKSRVIRDHLGQALPNERAVTLRAFTLRALNRAPTGATKLRGLFFVAFSPSRCRGEAAIQMIQVETCFD